MFVIKLNDPINCQIAQHTATVLNYVHRDTDMDVMWQKAHPQKM